MLILAYIIQPAPNHLILCQRTSVNNIIATPYTDVTDSVKEVHSKVYSTSPFLFAEVANDQGMDTILDYAKRYNIRDNMTQLANSLGVKYDAGWSVKIIDHRLSDPQTKGTKMLYCQILVPLEGGGDAFVTPEKASTDASQYVGNVSTKLAADVRSIQSWTSYGLSVVTNETAKTQMPKAEYMLLQTMLSGMKRANSINSDSLSVKELSRFSDLQEGERLKEMNSLVAIKRNVDKSKDGTDQSTAIAEDYRKAISDGDLIIKDGVPIVNPNLKDQSKLLSAERVLKSYTEGVNSKIKEVQETGDVDKSQEHYLKKNDSLDIKKPTDIPEKMDKALADDGSDDASMMGKKSSRRSKVKGAASTKKG